MTMGSEDFRTFRAEDSEEMDCTGFGDGMDSQMDRRKFEIGVSRWERSRCDDLHFDNSTAVSPPQ